MKSVAICCSQRFKMEMLQFSKDLERLGVSIVLIPDFRWHTKKRIRSPEQKRLKSQSYRRAIPGWVRGHLDKIRKVDLVYILNIDGYMGVNTTLELGAAHILGKHVYAHDWDKEEPCRNVLIDGLAKTPDDLVKKLR